ncbi:MAG: hypothetical protein J5I93_02955 [Pirellulaceae bacterium]|nr:hypothetical protein [Pirellulaceae bacterium]
MPNRGRSRAARRLRGLWLEPLEDRQLLAVVAPGGVAVPPSLEPFIPPPVLAEIGTLLTSGFTSAAIYHAFPGESNDLTISTGMFESLIYIDDSGQVPVVRLPPVVNKAVLDAVSVGGTAAIGFSADADARVYVAGDIGVGYEVAPIVGQLVVGFDVGAGVSGSVFGELGLSIELPFTEFLGGIPDVEAIAINPGGVGAILDYFGIGQLLAPLDPLLQFLGGANTSTSLTIPEINLPAILPLDVLDFSAAGGDSLPIPPIPPFDPSSFDNQFADGLTIPEFELPAGADVGQIIQQIPGLDVLLGFASYFASAITGELRMTVDLGDMDDRADLSALTIPTFVDGGTGNDSVKASPANDEFLGGEGNDSFQLNRQSLNDFDIFRGGPGDDTLLIPGTDTSDVIHLYGDADGNLVRYERYNTSGVLVAATNLTLIDVEEVQLLGEEGDDVLGSLGDDQVIVHGKLSYQNGVTFFGGDEIDSLEIRWDGASPLSVTVPQLSDDNFGSFEVDGDLYYFADVEDFVRIDANGARGNLEFEGGDESNYLRFAATGPGDATFNNDGQVGFEFAGFGNGSQVTMDGLNGGDTFAVALNGFPQFEQIEIVGGGPATTDSLIVEGTNSGDLFRYRPDAADTRAGQVTHGSSVVLFEDILDLSIVGLAGNDLLELFEPTEGSHDVVYFRPAAGNSGTFSLNSVTPTGPLVYAEVTFQGIETRRFNTGGGQDMLLVMSSNLPQVDSQLTIDGGNGVTTIDYGGLNPQFTEFIHDTSEPDLLSLEISSAHDRVVVTPGQGLRIAANLGLGNNTLVYQGPAGEDLLLDLDHSAIRTTSGNFGDVDFTGPHLVIDANNNRLSAVHTGDDDSDLTLRPTGTTSGSIHTADPYPFTAGFRGASQLQVSGDGVLTYMGSDFVDSINVVQDTADTVRFQQLVQKGGGSPVAYVPVEAMGYAQVHVHGGRDADLFRVEVDQSLATDPLNRLSFSIDGQLGQDRLVVVDDEQGDTILRREEVDELSGFVKIGGLEPVVYAGVETVQIFPFDPVTAGTGADRLGREVILESDPLEPNDNRLAAHEVSALEGVNRNPNIGVPGIDLFGDAVLGDEDWYRFEATTTGTYRFQLLFEMVPTLPNGQPGLPGNGDLDLTIYDAQGNFIADGVPWEVLGSPLGTEVDSGNNPITPPGVQLGPTGETIDIGIEQGTTVYARVRGHWPVAVNDYDVIVLSPAEQAEGAIPDLRRDDADPENDAEISPPPGGGLRIGQSLADGTRRYVEINSFNPADAPRSIFPPEQDVRPTFAVESITVFLEDFPPRAPGFQYEAIHETIALQPGNYSLVGEHSGPITIDSIEVHNDPVILGQVATGSVTLRFHAPLPDDRFTLTIKDTLVDPALRPLDGETNALAPVSEDEFASGNGVPGGDFIGNFSIDTRVEIGTFYAGSFWLDLNQNGIFDPDNPNPLNRDVVFQFGDNEGLVDKPVIGDWNGDGFDEVGLYALDPTAGVYNFRLDRNANGIFDPGASELRDPPEFPLELSAGVAGNPVAGDWNNDGIDEVGLLVTGEWLLDLDGNGQINPASEQFTTNFFGQPFAGDWDGTGIVRVASYNPHTGEFWIDMDNDKWFDDGPGGSDLRIHFQVPGLERPLVGDFDADFDTNVGLLIANTIEASPGLIAQWLLDVGDPDANPLMSLTRPADFDSVGSPGEGRFQPAPTGHRDRPLVFQDVFYEVGDARFAPFAGNFDLPSTRINEPLTVEEEMGGGGPGGGGPGGGGTNDNPLHNELLPPDVNASGTVAPDDANLIAIFLGANGIQPIDGLTNPGDFYADVDNDRMITPQDYLAVIGYLQGGGGGEGDQRATPWTEPRPDDVGYYTNYLLRRDTNLDGVVSPNDALIIANQLNTFGPGDSLGVRFNRQFVDPNGDEFVAPSDFLYIVNYLIDKSSAALGEGEADAGSTWAPVLALPGPGPADTSAESLDRDRPAADRGNLATTSSPAGLSTSGDLPVANGRLVSAAERAESSSDLWERSWEQTLDEIAEDVGLQWGIGSP